MYKFWSHRLDSMPLNAVGLVAFVFIFFLAGCTKNTIPMFEPAQATSTEVLPTPPESPKSTSAPEAGMTKSAPHVSPYFDLVVTDVEIRYLETDPVQAEVVIRGTLPDQCKYEFYSLENRRNQDVKITLKVRHPAGDCDQSSQNVEYVLLLGKIKPEAERGFAPGDYTLIVNKFQTVFTIKEK